MKIGILVDSSATSQPELFTNEIIEWIPLHITYGSDVDILDTNENVKNFRVFERIESGEDWKTSQASPGEVEKKYDEMLEKYEHVIHIPITENLSSMMSTALMVAREERYQSKVTVIQNKTLAAQGIKEMAFHLATLIQNGSLTTPEMVVKEFERSMNSLYIAIIPSDLRKLASGGRAVKIISTILNILRTKTLIKWQEKPEKEGIARTAAGLMDRVIQHVTTEFNGTYNFILTTTSFRNEKAYQKVVEELKENNIRFTEEPIPNLYPVHAGIQTIGFIVSPFAENKK